MRFLGFVLMLIVALGLGCGDDPASSKGGSSDQVALSPQEEIHGSSVAPVEAQGDFWAPCIQTEQKECAGPNTACLGLGWAGEERRCSQRCDPEECPEGARCSLWGVCAMPDSLYYWIYQTCTGGCPDGFRCDRSQTPDGQCMVECEADDDCVHIRDQDVSGSYCRASEGLCVLGSR